jgi:hypothetical protein
VAGAAPLSRLWNVWREYRIPPGANPPVVELLGDPMTVGAFDVADLRRLLDRMDLLGGAAVREGERTALLFDGDPAAPPRSLPLK